MNARRKGLWFALAALALAPPTGLALLSWLSTRPSNLGARDGRLADCPDTPNCVATRTDAESQRMAPLVWRGSVDEALERLTLIIEAMPRSRVITASAGYLHAEFSTPCFGFVDDVEFLVAAEQGEIQFRSASRVGRSDLGVNRDRMEHIIRQWQTAAPASH